MIIKLTYECDDPKQRGEITITETQANQFVMAREFDPPVHAETANPYGVLGKFLDVMTLFNHPELPKKD